MTLRHRPKEEQPQTPAVARKRIAKLLEEARPAPELSPLDAAVMAQDPPPMRRANFLPAPHYFLLNQACAVVNQAFESSFGCYLVGSSLRKRDYRDCDVRLILDDAEFDKLFRSASAPQYNALWSLMCASIALHLSQASGLPVDFQIQRQTEANAEFSAKDGHHRHALGIFRGYPGGG